jgi:hypothetical protein
MRSLNVLPLFGAAAMLAGVALGGLPAIAQAAGRPDFTTGFLGFTSSPARGETFKVAAMYWTQNNTSGPATVTVMFPEAFGEPTITDNGGYWCETKYSGGVMPGWLVTCAQSSVSSDGIGFQVKAPLKPGTYGIISSIKPRDGADADESDNVTRAVITVR